MFWFIVRLLGVCGIALVLADAGGWPVPGVLLVVVPVYTVIDTTFTLLLRRGGR